MHAVSELDGTNGFKARIAGQEDSTLVKVPSGNYTSAELTNMLNGATNFDNSGNYTLLADEKLNLTILINASRNRNRINY